jgi:hypothetical protein
MTLVTTLSPQPVVGPVLLGIGQGLLTCYTAGLDNAGSAIRVARYDYTLVRCQAEEECSRPDPSWILLEQVERGDCCTRPARHGMPEHTKSWQQRAASGRRGLCGVP